ALAEVDLRVARAVGDEAVAVDLDVRTALDVALLGFEAGHLELGVAAAAGDDQPDEEQERSEAPDHPLNVPRRRLYIKSRRARARRIFANACSWSCRMRSRDRLYLSPISLSVSSCSVPRPKRWRRMSASIGRKSRSKSRTSAVSASHSRSSVGEVSSRSGSSRTSPSTRPSSSPTGLSIDPL